VSVLVDTSVLVDYLRGNPDAAHVLESARAVAPLHSSEIVRLEVLAGMHPNEEGDTTGLLSTITWHPVTEDVVERAGALGRQWLPSHHTIDAADLAIAATVMLNGCELYTRNTRHFPMFPGLQAPY